MKKTNRYWKFVLITLGSTLVISCAILLAVFLNLTSDQKVAIYSIFIDQIEFFALFALIFIAVLFGGLEVIYASYVKPIKKISAEAEVIYASNPSHRLQIPGNKDIHQLCDVINDFAELFENLNKNVTDQILRARKDTEKERNLLAAIMSELPQGVIICNSNGRILLFNSIAKKLLTAEIKEQRPEYFLGLGRSIFHLIDKGLIAQAIDQIQEHIANDHINVSSTFISPTADHRLINIETIPVLDTDRNMTGFILTLDDVTKQVNQYDLIVDKIDHEKKELAFHISRVRNWFPKNEWKDFNHTFEQIAFRYDNIADILIEAIIKPMPLSPVPIADLMYSIQRSVHHNWGISLNLSGQEQEHRILTDFYSFSSAIEFLISKISLKTGVHEIALSVKRNGNLIAFSIYWNTTPIPEDELESLLKQKINALPSLHYILMQNKIEHEMISDEQGQCFQINIVARAKINVPLVQRHRSPVITGSRPEFYDFNLFKTDEADLDLLDSSLKQLTYTVFDTETTGLNPDGGDEIISIAAVRVVNGRIVYQDIFEELVDPKRDIPMESYNIHGISYEMVSGKDDIQTILPLFQQYVSDTILVGHNIAFDMKMLKVKERTTNIIFSNPVLDTLLLSAILHPVHEQHDMESIAKRLGVNIIGRHTALGDAIATAEIFLKIIEILNSNGILTLKDAIKASRRSYYARLKY